ncbi:MAG: selenide, water dikinase SelD, partial [Planctomycetota bacterium]
NSVSDIYAMGGIPITALSVLGFPVRKIPDNVMNEILCGGIDKMKEACVAIIGGHSINDSEIKGGFAVTGIIDKDKIITNAGARPGDCLILTKPLGTGIVAFAAQIERARPESVEAADNSMTALNKTASELMVQFGAHACTDVTGFSLMGHLTEMASSSGVDVEIIFDSLPLFPGVLEYAAAGILPGAIERNKESCSHKVKADTSLAQEMVDICYDAQTSGGLLISIDEKKVQDLLEALHSKGITDAAVIGKIKSKGNGQVVIKTDNSRSIPKMKDDKEKTTVNKSQTSENTDDVPCCADAVGEKAKTAAGASEMQQVEQKFKDFLSSASSPHGLDSFTKQAIAIALSVAMRCEPCLKMHLKNAKSKGFTQEEIDETAWMGISFGGSPTMVFYENIKNALGTSNKS